MSAVNHTKNSGFPESKDLHNYPFNQQTPIIGLFGCVVSVYSITVQKKLLSYENLLESTNSDHTSNFLEQKLHFR